MKINLPRAGWRAVRYLPRVEAQGELLLDASGLTFVDAWVATVGRTLIEYRARDQQTPVRLIPPSSDGPRALWIDALGELPAHAQWTRSRLSLVRSEPRPLLTGTLFGRPLADRVVLPAQRINDAATARDIGRLLPKLARQANTRWAALVVLIIAFREFVENAVTHGAHSPIGAIATITHDPDRGSVALVVADLGDGVPANAFEGFVGALQSPARDTDVRGITGVLESARLRRFTPSLTVITANHVLRYSGEEWTVHAIGQLPGFVVGLELRP